MASPLMSLRLIVLALCWLRCATRFVAVDQITSPLPPFGSLDDAAFGDVLVCVPAADNGGNVNDGAMDSGGGGGGNHEHLIVSSPSAGVSRVLSYDFETLTNEQTVREDAFFEEHRIAVSPTGSTIAIFSPSAFAIHLYELSPDGDMFIPLVYTPRLNVTNSLTATSATATSATATSATATSYDCTSSSIAMSTSYLAINCVERKTTSSPYRDVDELEDDMMEDDAYVEFVLVYEMDEDGAFDDERCYRVDAMVVESDTDSLESISLSDDLLVVADELGNVYVYNNSSNASSGDDGDDMQRSSLLSSPSMHTWTYAQTLAPPAAADSIVSSEYVASEVEIMSLGGQRVLAQAMCTADGELSVVLWDSMTDPEDGAFTGRFYDVGLSVSVPLFEDAFGLDLPEISLAVTDTLIVVGVASTDTSVVELFQPSRDEFSGKLALTQPADVEDDDGDMVSTSRVSPPSLSMGEFNASSEGASPSDTYFGTSVAICSRNGERVLVVGAPSRGIEYGSGMVYVFEDVDSEGPDNATNATNSTATETDFGDFTTSANISETLPPDTNSTDGFFNVTTDFNANSTDIAEFNTTQQYGNETLFTTAEFDMSTNVTSDSDDDAYTSGSDSDDDAYTNGSSSELTTSFSDSNVTESFNSSVFTTEMSTTNSEEIPGGGGGDGDVTETATEAAATDTTMTTTMTTTTTTSDEEKTKYTDATTTTTTTTTAVTATESETATSTETNNTFIGSGDDHQGVTNQPIVVGGESDANAGVSSGYPDENVALVAGFLFFMGVIACLMCVCYRKYMRENRYVGLEAPGDSLELGYEPPRSGRRRGSSERTRRGNQPSFAELQGLNRPQKQQRALPL